MRDWLGSTYRLQLAGIGFAGARAQVAYFHELGIETLYVSPVLAAVPGSTHGYDVIDPDRLDPSLGTPEEFEALLDELASHAMALLIDIVPNHMAVHPANQLWWETLREGENSAPARVFDIDWARHQGRVLVPTLSRPLAELASSARISNGEDGPELELDSQRFPLRRDDDGSNEALLAKQHYRTAFWRLSSQEGNYRRFFNIDSLIGVRVEDPAVFERTHGFIAELCRDERIAGVRVDHIDGLTDPAGYAQGLRDILASRPARKAVLVEKILARDEALRVNWAVDGTTGYEFAEIAGGLLISGDGARSLSELGAELTGDSRSFHELSLEAKREVLAQSFQVPLERIARLAFAVLEIELPGHDLAVSDLREAVAEMTVRLGVYRTYLDHRAPSPEDRGRIDAALATAVLSPQTKRAAQLVRQGLLAASRPGSLWLEVAQRWQQLTVAVTAKGVEDRATYRYSGLLAQAEVGCDPDHPQAGPAQLSDLARAHRRRPASLNATSTHDSKRNEDARARLYALSEAASEWDVLVRRWHRRRSKWAGTGPDAHDELVAYQTLAALWPLDGSHLPSADRQRAQNYAIKAAREAKRRSAWVDPDLDYEAELSSYIAELVKDPRFQKEMGRFLRRIGPAAVSNSLSLVVLKSMTPGVPDFYQGTELLEPSLTDPDNRRPVDFRQRRALLDSLPPVDASPGKKTAAADALCRDWSSGSLKMYTIRALLHLRRAEPLLFEKGSCQLLEVKGARGKHLIALARRQGSRHVLALAPRLSFGLAGPGRFPIKDHAWGKTTLRVPDGAPASFTDVLTGRTVAVRRGRLEVGEVLDVLPVAVLCDNC